MMSNQLPRGAAFWAFLFAIDQDLAEQTRQEGCQCGGRLHRANYPRNPRGCADGVPDEYSCRLSFCCDREGCRKRATPPSVRFMGQKVYLSVIVVLIAAMREGPTPRRVQELSKLIGADRTTISRWRRFWLEQFPQTSFWKVARGRLAPIADVASPALALLEAFLRTNDLWEDLRRLLLFLAPTSVPGGLNVQVS